MAILDFPDDQYFIVLESSGAVTQIAEIVPDETQFVEHILIWVQKVGGPSGGDEYFKMNIYSHSDYSDASLLGQSSLFAISEFPYITTNGSYFGYARFDFDSIALVADERYYIAIDTVDYTSADDSYYFAVALDWPNEINTAETSYKRGAQMSIISGIE